MDSLTITNAAFLLANKNHSEVNDQASRSLEEILLFLQEIHFHKIIKVSAFTAQEKYSICEAVIKMKSHRSNSAVMKMSLLQLIMTLPHEYQHEIFLCILCMKRSLNEKRFEIPDMTFESLTCVLFVLFKSMQNDLKTLPSIPNHPLLSGLRTLAEASEKKWYAYVFIKSVELGDQIHLKNVSGLWVWEFCCEKRNMDSDFSYASKRLSFCDEEDTLPLPKGWYKFIVFKNKRMLRNHEDYQIIFSRTKIQTGGSHLQKNDMS